MFGTYGGDPASKYLPTAINPLRRTQSILLQLSLILYSSNTMATDIRTSELKSPVDVAEYLFARLHQLGVRSIHGVPGDYN